eukprot:3886819-Prorocentrum_lima.AAC.1
MPAGEQNKGSEQIPDAILINQCGSPAPLFAKHNEFVLCPGAYHHLYAICFAGSVQLMEASVGCIDARILC